MSTAAQSETQSSEGGLSLSPHQIIIRPLVTEKGIHKAGRFNRYAFEVAPSATKDQIKAAVQELFNVKVIAVATQNRKGKERRYRMKTGMTKSWKRAIVKLHEDNKLDLF
jgi:large subunit ribosomal protein L23